MLFTQLPSVPKISLSKTINRASGVIMLLTLLFTSVDLTAQQRQRTPQKPIEEQAETYRNAIFETINFKYGILNGMSRGNIPANDAIFAQAAKDVNALAGMILEGFTLGSQEYPGMTTDAVWKNQEEFFELIEDFQEKTAALAAVADKGVDATTSEVTSFRQTCGGCHRNYRERIN